MLFTAVVVVAFVVVVAGVDEDGIVVCDVVVVAVVVVVVFLVNTVVDVPPEVTGSLLQLSTIANSMIATKGMRIHEQQPPRFFSDMWFLTFCQKRVFWGYYNEAGVKMQRFYKFFRFF